MWKISFGNGTISRVDVISISKNGGKNILIDLICPNVCGVCEKVCKIGLCVDCLNLLGKSIDMKIEQSTNSFFTKHIYFFKYEGIFRDRLLLYKFKNKAYLYKFFTQIIIKNKKECSFLKNYDIITPVPIHKKRKRERGYNQSALIAKEISKDFKNLKYSNALKKVKNTLPQSSLNRLQRKKNIANAYKINDINIISKKIILFDDIFTTGATANECSKVLKNSGASEIIVMTLAKD